jgi:hypothetical protein
MRSSGSPEYLSLDTDLPTTSDDVAALARFHAAGSESFGVYLRFLTGFPSPPLAVLRARRGPGGAPFELAAVGREESGASPLAEG